MKFLRSLNQKPDWELKNWNSEKLNWNFLILLLLPPLKEASQQIICQVFYMVVTIPLP